MTGPKVIDHRYKEAVETTMRVGTDIKRPLTVIDVARGLGVSRDTVYRWLRGEGEINMNTMQPFLKEKDWRGALAWVVHDIWEDNQRKKLKKYLRR